MAYVAVTPKELERQGAVTFPGTLGVTSRAIARIGRLVPHGREGAVTLEFECADFDYDAHPSIGVAAGRYVIDMAMRRTGAWTGCTVLLNGTPHQLPSAIPDGAYQVCMDIDAHTAQEIQSREEEHLEDFRYAWSRTYGDLRTTAAAVTPAASHRAAIDKLVARLTELDQLYLVPADPHDLESWGRHIATTYGALSDHSKKRDHRGDHSSAHYVLTVDATQAPTRLLVRPALKPANRDSASYLRTDELPVVHTGAATAHTAGRPRLVIGDVATWTDTQVRADDGAVYPRLGDTTDGVFYAPAVFSAIGQGLPVARDDGAFMWLKVDLTTGHLFPDLAVMSWTVAYLRAQSAHLRAV